MFKKSILVTILFIFNTAIQLISQIVVTRLFGAKIDLEIFLAAVSIPTILVTVIYGSLNEAFLPLYGKKKLQSEEEAQSFFISHVFQLTFLSFILALIAGFFTDFISHLLYSSRGELFVQSVSLQMKYLLYSMPVSIIATLFGSYFYAKKDFLRFPLAQALASIVNLLLIIFLQSGLGVWALVVAFILNILFQIFLVIPRDLFGGSFKFVNIFPFLLSWIPLFIGTFALRSDALLIRSFSAYLPEGYIVYLNLVSKIFSLATGVMTVGIQIVLLPHLVDYFHTKDYQKATSTINKAKMIAVAVSVLITFLVLLFSPFVIELLFVGGRFTTIDATNTITLLPLFVLPAIGWGVSSIFSQPLLALHKQTQVGIMNVLSLAFGWLVATFTNIYFGPLPAISSGLITLLFTGIIGNELLWQFYKKRLMKKTQEEIIDTSS